MINHKCNHSVMLFGSSPGPRTHQPRGLKHVFSHRSPTNKISRFTPSPPPLSQSLQQRCGGMMISMSSPLFQIITPSPVDLKSVTRIRPLSTSKLVYSYTFGNALNKRSDEYKSGGSDDCSKSPSTQKSKRRKGMD